jgi:uncharacterized membrane protein
MAVAHDAAPIAILGLIGGFLSPVLLSTGTNHPYALFTYIAILNFVAMGAAYFRRWRALDLFCFLGTSILYQGWYRKFYAPDQMMPALLYTSSMPPSRFSATTTCSFGIIVMFWAS